MAAPADPDAQLMLRVQSGDAAAFAGLVEKYKQPVINFVFRTVQDAHEAEDIAQTVFVQAYRAAPKYRATAKFNTWLFTIARNYCLNELRRRARHPQTSLHAMAAEDGEEFEAQIGDAAAAPADAEALNRELERHIETAVADLPEAQRTAILLCRQDMAYEEIAQVLGCSVSATKSVIFRARETLKQRLKPYLGSGEWQEK